MPLLRIPSAMSQIEIFEVEKAAVLGSARPTGSTGHKAARGGKPLKMPKFSTGTGFSGACIVPQSGSGQPSRWLDFSSWDLFHAAVKSMMLTHAPEEAHCAAVSFGCQYASSFSWNGTIALVPGNLRARRKDSARTDLAARLGEGLAHLVMQRRFKYVYWDSLESVFERRTTQLAGSHPEAVRNAKANRPMPNGEQPDFIFEDALGSVALAECKGHFVYSTTKRVPFGSSLRKGLSQLKKWPPLFTPQPSRSFAFNACLAESTAKVPSFIAYVDPEETTPNDGLPVGDAIRRGNYAAWLLAMGFPEHALALRSYRRGPETTVRLPVVEVRDHRYAVVASRFGPPWFYGPRFDRTDELFVLGLDVTVLERVKRAIAGQQLAGSSDESVESRDRPATGDAQGGEFIGSVMPDGSLIGAIRAPRGFVEVLDDFEL